MSQLLYNCDYLFATSVQISVKRVWTQKSIIRKVFHSASEIKENKTNKLVLYGKINKRRPPILDQYFVKTDI